MVFRATGSQRARFAELIEQHRKIVFKVANSYARLADDRADLAQKISAQLWRAFPGCDEARAFSTWMYRIALLVAISHLRNAERRDMHTVPLDEYANRGDLVGSIMESAFAVFRGKRLTAPAKTETLRPSTPDQTRKRR